MLLQWIEQNYTFPKGKLTYYFSKEKVRKSISCILHPRTHYSRGQIGCQLLPPTQSEPAISLGIDTHTMSHPVGLSYSIIQHRRRRDLTFKGRRGRMQMCRWNSYLVRRILYGASSEAEYLEAVCPCATRSASRYWRRRLRSNCQSTAAER